MMFDRSLLNPMLSGKDLYDALLFLPDYDESICNDDASTRLVALSELYNIYLPSAMSEEIYSKLYLSLLRSLNKKGTLNSIKQLNENFKCIRNIPYKEVVGVVGGSDSFTIIGSSGIGKSSAISRAVSLITDKSFIEVEGTKICPFVIVQCPFDSSVKGLALEILRKIDSVLETKYYANAIRSHATIDVLIGMISQAALNHIGLLIIDEIQNVATSKNGKAFINSLTQLINNSGISICMVGTPESTVFFKKELQLARRSVGLYYSPLQYDEYFFDFCRTAFSYQYTRKKAEINAGIIEWLYEHSGGLVSLVISLIHDAQEIAILSGTEFLDLNTLNEAYTKRTAMLHGFINEGSRTLPQTGKLKKKSEQAVLENRATIKQWQGLSISEIVLQAKKSRYDVVDVLKQYITIEEIDKEGCKLC